MVTVYGMSDRLGPISFDSSGHSIFIGRDFGQTKSYSEETAAIIDEEVKHIFDEAALKCEEILRAHADVLVALAEYLLINETIDGEDFRYFCDHKCMPPLPEKSDAVKQKESELLKGNRNARRPRRERGSEERTGRKQKRRKAKEAPPVGQTSNRRGVVIYEEEEALGLSKSPLLRQGLQPCIPTLLQYSSSAALILRDPSGLPVFLCRSRIRRPVGHRTRHPPAEP